MISVYTDGSYRHELQKGSYAIVILNDEGKILGTKSGVLSDPRILVSRNIGPELYAVLLAINILNNKEVFDENEPVEFYHDYEGIAKWITGKWSAKKKLTAWYIKTFLDNIGKREYSFKHVKGHSGNAHNELADKLCAGAYYSV